MATKKPSPPAKGFKPCSACKTPKACAAANKCMAKGMKNGGKVKGKY